MSWRPSQSKKWYITFFFLLCNSEVMSPLARLSKPRSKPILTDMCALPSSRDPHPSTHANDATEKTRCLTSLPLAKSPANAGNPLGVIRIAIFCSEKIPPQCTRRFLSLNTPWFQPQQHICCSADVCLRRIAHPKNIQSVLGCQRQNDNFLYRGKKVYVTFQISTRTPQYGQLVLTRIS